MLRIERIVPWLSIRGKLITAFVGLSVVPVALVGVYGLVSNIGTLRSIALASLTHDVRTIRERAGNFLAGVESDLRVLRNSTHLDAYVSGVTSSGHTPDRKTLRQIGDDLLAFAGTKKMYFQLRLVNLERDEVVRIQCESAGPSSQCRMVPDSGLRRGGEAYYFLLTQDLHDGQIAFSPAEVLFREHMPIPVLSFAMRLGKDSANAGLLIANVYASELFSVMESERGFGTEGRVALVGDDGHDIYRSDSTERWNAFVASRDENNLGKEYPAWVAAAILSGAEGTVEKGSDEFIAHAPLFAPPGNEQGLPSSRLTESLFVYEAVPSAAVMASVRAFGWTFGGFLVVLLACAITLGLVATTQFTRPIGEVREGADIIAMGKYEHRLHVQTHDEIEQLADRFNTMATALETHERELERHRLRLEEMVDHRTAELAGEKSKLQAILDNVPSAFVLLDREFRIQTASASFAAVTGFRFEDVRGQDCRLVFQQRAFCRGAADSQGILTGKTDSHVDVIHDGSAAQRYIEHTTLPVVENGAVGSIIEIFTDVTKRKQLEQFLVQSEKLMATGEMAAIIAHEFRNALTSIKMILQLQRESRSLARADRKSLTVALESIDHMESVVRDLLNFSRPAQMEFKPVALSGLMEESIAFARLRIRHQDIHVSTALDRNVPPLRVDASLLKEAVINLLLNSIQALESPGTQPVPGMITIATRQAKLPATIRDFDSADLRDDHGPLQGMRGGEILLVQGMDCVFISITDNGPGITPQNLQRIFDPFFTTKPNGTGLGLPMVKRTVNAHGGIVTARNVQDGGASFEIVLPLDQLAEGTSAARRKSPALSKAR